MIIIPEWNTFGVVQKWREDEVATFDLMAAAGNKCICIIVIHVTYNTKAISFWQLKVTCRVGNSVAIGVHLDCIGWFW